MTRELRKEHKGFQEWDAGSNKRDHQAIVQALLNNLLHNIRPYAPIENHNCIFFSCTDTD